MAIGSSISWSRQRDVPNPDFICGVGATGSAGVPASAAPGTGVGTTLGRIGFGYNYPQFKAQMESYTSNKVRVLDFSDMLTAENFRDEVHPNQTGAEKITRALAQELGLGPAK